MMIKECVSSEKKRGGMIRETLYRTISPSVSYSKCPYRLNRPSTSFLNFSGKVSSKRWCTLKPDREALPEYAGPIPFFVVPILR